MLDAKVGQGFSPDTTDHEEDPMKGDDIANRLLDLAIASLQLVTRTRAPSDG